ncbi:MAG: type I methionyl aminopeptidase [Spirochaetales bacterium]|nr:MAG: type I methionyl aminopeptidase [Spirochaetales bacterium]
MIKLKNLEQMKGIRRSCELLSEMFAVIKPMVIAGITTGELDREARAFISSRGAVPSFLGYYDYPAGLCISINEEVIHGIPGKRRLENGDVVGIDCGINLDGYFSDAALTIAVPPVAPKCARLLQVTRECLDRAIAAVKPGGRIHDISRAVYGHARTAGFGVVRQYCGHGVGLAVHEDPQVPNYIGAGPNPRIVPGMVLAIEPMINLGGDGVEELDDGWTVVTRDRSISAHFEHTVAITAEGVQVLTSW